MRAPNTPGGTVWSRRHWLKAAAAWSAITALPLRAAPGATPQILDLDWVDTARSREVPVRLYLPGTGSAPTPLVVFSHGLGGSRRGYSYLGQHFAAQGVASLHLQHVGSDRRLWGGNTWQLFGRLLDAAQETEAVARAFDLRFALDTLLADPLGARLDAQRIVAAGHSYGANTALLAAGARVVRDGQPLELKDERVRAAILISAPPFYGEGDPRRILSSVTVPSLHVTATEDVIRIPGYFSAPEDRIEVFDAIGSRRKWLAVFKGGSHSMFTDRSHTGGVALNPLVKSATAALALAFVHQVFDADGAGLAAWPQQHADILSRFTAVPALATA